MDSSYYFGGKTAYDGKVHVLAAKDFKSFAQSQLFVPVPIDMLRKDFLAHPDRDKLKDVAYVTPAVYAPDETRRSTAGAKAFNLVIIDLDGGEDAKDFSESPEALQDALNPYNFVAWNTAKHTPDAPRLKIAVDCSESDPSLYGRAVDYVVERLGLPKDFKGSSESHVISQLHYRPVVFKGEDFTSVIASQLKGKPLDPASLDPAVKVPDDDDDVFAYVPKAGDQAIGDILNLPSPNVTLDDVREALTYLDPDSQYPVWASIAACMRHQFVEESEAREAFEDYNDFSARGKKYRGREVTLRKWRSFSPYPEGRLPMTVRSLFRMAIDAGWEPVKVNTRVVESFSEWCESATQQDLMSEGVKRIATMPVRNSITEELMADMVVKALKQAGAKVSKMAVVNEVKRVRTSERMETARVESPAWMKPFCFIGPQDKFRNNITGVEYTVDAFNHTFSRHLISETEPTADGRPAMTPANYALNIADTKIVDGVMYDPREKAASGSAGRESYFERDGRTYVNAFLEASVPKATQRGSKRAGNLVKKLLRANLANPEYEQTVLDFLAYCVQRPGEKIRWAIFFQGGQGCGKGTLIDTVKAAIGLANFKVITGSTLTGTFDDYREGAHFIYCDELFSAGANRHEVNNKVKDGVTNDVITVNKKFKDTANVPNVSNYFMTSNKHDALILEDSDRRYMVLKSRLQTSQQVREFSDTGIMASIHEMLADPETSGAFRQFYLDHKISESFDPNGHAPVTRFRDELVDAGKNLMLIQIEDLISDPEYPLIGEDVIHYSALETATAVLGKNNARPSHYLYMLGYQSYEKNKRFDIDGEKTRIYTHVDRFVDGIDDAVEILKSRMNDI